MDIELHRINFKDHAISKYADSMQSIIAPLKELGGIDYFSYKKLFKHFDHTKEIVLTTHPSFTIDIVYPEKFYELMYCGDIDQYHDGFYLWDFFYKDTVIYQALLENTQRRNGILITKEGVNYCEFFIFGTKNKNNMISHFFLSQVQLFEAFILYFKEKARNILLEAEKNKIIMPKSASDTVILPAQESLKAFKSKLLIEKKWMLHDKNLHKFINFHHKQNFRKSNIENNLTPRESQCASHLIQGQNTKKIAGILHISKRTVEKHIENLRIKMQAQSRVELVAKLLKNEAFNDIQIT